MKVKSNAFTKKINELSNENYSNNNHKKKKKFQYLIFFDTKKTFKYHIIINNKLNMI